MLAWSWLGRKISTIVAAGGGVRGGGGPPGFWLAGGGRWNVAVAVGLTAMAGLALAATLVISSRRGSFKSPWFRRKRKHTLSPHQWNSLFTPDGKLCDAIMFLKRVRSGGVDPSIRAEVWPFLLGVYSLDSSKDERNDIRMQKRKEYKKLRKRCHQLLDSCNEGNKDLKDVGVESNEEKPAGAECPMSENEFIGRDPLAIEGEHSEDLDKPLGEHSEDLGKPLLDGATNSSSCTIEGENSDITNVDDAPAVVIESSDSDISVEEPESMHFPSSEETDAQCSNAPLKTIQRSEDFSTWQRIIRLDAIRANGEWIPYSPSQAAVSESRAVQFAEEVGLKDYDNLEPCRIYHAARLVAILEAYTLYDDDIGYCQGMSDLLSPILSVMEEDHEAFWCFVGFMRKARHNFRLDEVGIRRQLSIVSKIIKWKDSHLYKHLERLQAQDCFFVYRMVVVLFRRELTFEQSLCLWEVMWADQAAIRAGIGQSAWGKTRMSVPPTDDLLLYAIAASVLHKRKLIIEKHNSMEEIMKECHGMAGQLDVWKLLDDAHDLVVTLHDKIS